VRLQTFVQTVPGRERALAHTMHWLRRSDLSEPPRVLEHPHGITVRAFLLMILREMAECDAELVVRFEDDVTVSAHIEANVLSWPELHDARFGAGWLFAAAGARTIIDYAYQRPGTSRWEQRWVHGSCAVLFWRHQLPAIIEAVERIVEREPPSYCGQDKLIGEAVFATGKQLCVHVPSLVEHELSLGSSLGHALIGLYDAAREGFQRNWLRGQRFSAR
jgi:hypothetical protein